MADLADRNLLLGVIAVQLNFVSRDALVAGMNVWASDSSRSLGQVLCDLGQLTPERLRLLSALVDEHVAEHGGDPRKSLAALPPLGLDTLTTPPVSTDASVQATILQGAKTPPAGSKGRPTASSPATAPRYRIIRPHARGGLGEVFVAEDTELGRQVAVKAIQSQYAHRDDSRQRFVLEAEVTGGLEHPGVVPVYGLGYYADGRPYYAMRFIEGETLKDAIVRFHDAHGRSSPGFDSLEFRQLLRRFVDVCNAVAYAHSRGVIHRDIKPVNVMLGKFGETLVVDWGLAKAVGRADVDRDPTAESTLHPRSAAESSGTLMGQALGTPAYMPPEQAFGRLDELGPASDVFSLGATLFEVLTGRAPFDGPAPEVIDKVRAGDFPTPRTFVPTVPKQLDAIVRTAMATIPRDRYPTPLALSADVERWLADEPVTAWPEPWYARAGRWVRRNKALVASAGVICAALVTAGVWTGLTRAEARGRVAAAEAEADAARQVSAAQEYYGLFSRSRERATRAAAGWSWTNLDDLARAARLSEAARHRADLLTELSAALGGPDVRPREPVAIGLSAAAIAYDPGGRWLAVAQHKSPAFVLPASVALVDVHTGLTARTLTFPPSREFSARSKVQDGGWSVAFSPDGRWLVVGARSGQLHRWDLTAEPPARTTWVGHGNAVVNLAFSPDGTALFSSTGRGDDGLKRWGAATDWSEQAVARTTGRAGGFVMARNGEWIAWRLDGSVKFLAPDSLQEARSAVPLVGAGTIALGPAGRTIIADSDRTLALIDAESGTITGRIRRPSQDTAHENRIDSVATGPNGTLFASVGRGAGASQLCLWDALSRELLTTLSVPGEITRLAFRPDGRELAVIGPGKTLRFEIGGWDVRGTSATSPGPLRAAAVGAGRLATVGGAADNDVSVEALDGSQHGRPTRIAIPVPGRVAAIAVSPEWLCVAAGDKLYSCDLNGSALVSLDSLPRDEPILRVASDGRLWIATESEVRVYSPPRPGSVAHWSNAASAMMTGKASIWGLAAGRQWVLAARRDGALTVLRAANATPVATMGLDGGEELLAVALNPAETFAVVGTARGRAHLVALPAGPARTLDAAHLDGVDAAVFLNDRVAATGSRDGMIHLWDCTGGQLQHLMSLRCRGPVASLAVSNGRLYAHVEGERGVRVWDVNRLAARLGDVAPGPDVAALVPIP